MVYLLPTLTFSPLAQLVQAHQPHWLIKELRACTFPSRPEPKRALWIDSQEQPTLQFCYDPDPEVRTVVVFDAAVASFAPDAALTALIPTTPWAQLHHAATAPATPYVERWRAIAAWRSRGEHAESASKALGKAHGEQEFALAFDFFNAMLSHQDTTARQIAAAQLEIWAEPRFRAALCQHSPQEPDLHVRLLLRRALDNIERHEMAAEHSWRRGSL